MKQDPTPQREATLNALLPDFTLSLRASTATTSTSAAKPLARALRACFPALRDRFQLFPILLRLVRIQRPELRQRLGKPAARAQIARNHQRIARPRMAPRQQLAAHLCIRRQSAPGQVVKLDRSLVIVQLPHQVLPPAHLRPAQKRIRLHLHRALSFRHALAVVVRRVRVGQIRRVGRRHLLLDLQKQRIARPLPSK